jgi:hypothetical protein
MWSPSAKADGTERDGTWGTVTGITAVAAMSSTVLMPRIYYADPQNTAGWKSRWHLAAMAPTMTLTMLTFLNEYSLKNAIKTSRPGCAEADDNTPLGQVQGIQGRDGHCLDYGSLSSHAFAGASAFGQGLSVFLVDTIKYSGGQVNGGALVGDVAMPLVLSVVTSVGRAAGNWEGSGTVVVSSLAGLGVGFLTGMTYAMMAQPDCGYTGALVCW